MPIGHPASSLAAGVLLGLALCPARRTARRADLRRGGQRLFEIGAEPVGGSVESFSERWLSDSRKWGQFIKETGIKLE
jgi:hypothetical protein